MEWHFNDQDVKGKLKGPCTTGDDEGSCYLLLIMLLVSKFIDLQKMTCISILCLCDKL